MTNVIKYMQTALALHIAQIPNRTVSSDGSLLHADIESETLYGEILQTRKVGDGIYNLKLKGTKHSARVLNHGRTTDGSEVLIIDTVLKPTWIFPTLPDPNHGPVIPLIALIIVPILIFILGGLMGMFFLTMRLRHQKARSRQRYASTFGRRRSEWRLWIDRTKCTRGLEQHWELDDGVI